MKYRKKPVVVEAKQLPRATTLVDDFHQWCNEVGFHNWASGGNGTIEIETLEGTMVANEGDWIIKGVKGEFYPCKDSIFQMTYEEVKDA